MRSFKLPMLLRTGRPFHKLRSFHLTPAEVHSHLHPPSPPQSLTGGTIPREPSPLPIIKPTLVINPHNNPLTGKAFVLLAIVASLFFISSISFAFIGENMDELYFKELLNKVARESPGVVLIGESVDVDIDEPSITIRWSLLGCGDTYVLPDSQGMHGSKLCGLPSMPLDIFVDSDTSPTGTYDPTQIPYNKITGERRSIQNLVQFDSDHVLDVHSARLYPFDTYFLTSTLRASSLNTSVPIRKLATIDVTSSFNIVTRDVESLTNSENGTQISSRDIDMKISRPGEARAFTLLLFAVSWVLTHVTIGHILLARRLTGTRPLIKHLLSAGAILVTIPQIRNSMPDAPGLDGVLIDSIGYFPQMVISGLSSIALLLMLASREIDLLKEGTEWHSQAPSISHEQTISYSPPVSRKRRPPPSPTAHSNSMEVAQYEMYRLMKHMKGQYVFPPVQPLALHHRKASTQIAFPHRKSKTLSRLSEGVEVKRWSIGSAGSD